MIMKQCFKFISILCVLMLGVNTSSAQQLRRVRQTVKYKKPERFYILINPLASYDYRVPVYSSVSAGNTKVACWLQTKNVYQAELNATPGSISWYKIYTYEGDYLGLINEKWIHERTAPAAPKFEMVHVKGGTFMMGDANDPEASPVHEVTVSDFEITKFEITEDQWNMVIGGGPNKSWDAVQNFIRILNRLTNKKYRLPTEAEWEYAAKGGHLSKGFKYSGSDNLDEVGWYRGNSNLRGVKELKGVGLKKPNELGLYDMSGHCNEFCQDFFAKYPEESQVNPVCTDRKSGLCVVRGGGIDTEADFCTTTKRSRCSTGNVDMDLSFRLVLDSPSGQTKTGGATTSTRPSTAQKKAGGATASNGIDKLIAEYKEVLERFQDAKKNGIPEGSTAFMRIADVEMSVKGKLDKAKAKMTSEQKKQYKELSDQLNSLIDNW